MWRAWALGGVVTVVLALWLASSAFAAFPGANGLLAAQPRTGRGIVLVSADGRSEQRICAGRSRCGTPRRPRWSADGRALVFAGPAIRIIYPDGSCLNCHFGAAASPAFKPDGMVISSIQNGRVALDKIDGNPESGPAPSSASDAVWSGSARLAVARGGTIWAGRPGHLTRIGLGSEPSWSPDGVMIAAAQHGWIVIIRLRDHRVRRLVRGSAPAFAPDGRWIAYVAPHYRLMIVRASGARVAPRRVGNIHAISVDWQPRPRRSQPGCVAPPGSSVLASSPAAVVTSDDLSLPPSGPNAPPIAYMGCLRADGRERLLERFDANTVDSASFVGSAVLAAPYVGLVLNSVDAHYGGQSSTLQIFDLRTGLLQTKLGGESVDCPDQNYPGPGCVLDQVMLGADGVSAAHTQAIDPVGSLSTPLTVSCAPATATCFAADPAGQVLVSQAPPTGAPSWTAATIAQPPERGPGVIACPSTLLCVGSGDDIFTTTDPVGGAQAWTSTALHGPPAYINTVSCPLTNLCVAVRIDGSIATSTDPTGGASAWSIDQIDRNREIFTIFCSTQPKCFISGVRTVFTSADPTGGVGAWSVSTSTPPFESGTCPTTGFCAAVGLAGLQTTTDPTAGTWTKQTAGGYLDGIACPSTTLCLAVGLSGVLDVSTSPASGGWTQTIIDDGRDLNSIACPSASLCVAADTTGHVVTSTNPTGGPSAWTPALIAGNSCADTTPCSVEQIQASDATGLHTVDSSKIPGTGPVMTGLTLTGDVLTWNHDGTQRSVPLTH